MILYQSRGKFGWYVAIGPNDVGKLGVHVDFYDAPIYTVNLWPLFCVSYWDYAPKWLDMLLKRLGLNVWWYETP